MTADGFSRFRPSADGAEMHTAFTNRTAEASAFDIACNAHADWVRTIDASDVLEPRRNTLNFYGVGGIGKTTLLHELERRLHTSDRPAASLVVNFEHPTAFDFEELLLRMRATIGSLGVQCVAFDLALTYYWEVVHPGLALETYTRSSSTLRKISGKLGFSEQIEASVVEVVSSIVSASQLAHGATRLAHAVRAIVTDRSRIRHAIRDCPNLDAFLDGSTVERSLSYMTSLLAWDLERAGNPRVVFFLDTYEEVTRQGRSTERIIQRLTYLLPNVLHVIAGRNRLDWDDDNLIGTLDYAGAKFWPALVGDTGTSTVIEVPELTAADADAYLRHRLVHDGAPAIPDSIRAQIVESAEGWPLYLDVAVDGYREALQAGRAPAERLAEPFAALVSRLSNDMSAEERTVLHVAALFSSFDEDLLTSSAKVSRNAVRRILARGFVKRVDRSAWPHSLHRALRDALRVDTGAVDSWTSPEWSAAAAHAVDALERRAMATRDRVVLAGCITTALELGSAYGTSIPWVVEQCIRLAQWNGLSGIRPVPGATGRAGVLSDLVRTVNEVNLLARSEVVGFLERALTLDLDRIERFWVRSIQASSLLDSGDVTNAERVYREILVDPPACILTREVRTMFALVLLKRGLFDELRVLCERPEFDVDRDRLLGDLHRHQARWETARAHYTSGLEQAENNSHRGLAQLFRAELALVDAWGGADPARWQLDTDSAGIWAQLSFMVAAAVSRAGIDPGRAHETLDVATTVAAGFGLQESLADIAIARAFVAATVRDSADLTRARAELAFYVRRSGTYHSWLDVVDCWLEELSGSPSAEAATSLDPPARAAWRRTLHSRMSEPSP